MIEKRVKYNKIPILIEFENSIRVGGFFRLTFIVNGIKELVNIFY